MNENQTNEPEKTEELTPEESKAMWDKVYAQIRQKEKDKRRRIIGAITTAVIVLFGVGIASYHWSVRPKVYWAESGPLDMKLKDGTTVRLLKGAKLIVENTFPGETREVDLEGSAVFRVSKSKKHPFIVHGHTYDTRVLGTVFKVIQDDESFKVDLYEGKVTVSKKESKNETYTLNPQETFNNYGARNITAITPLKGKESAGSSKTGRNESQYVNLRFNDCRLEDVLKVVEEVYTIKVTFPQEYKDRHITISFEGMSPDVALQSIALSMRLQLQQHDILYQLEK